MSQQDLIYRLKNREPEAFKELVESRKDRVYNVCLGFLHQPEDADDVAQEVFIQVYESIPGFREDSKLDTWIYRITVTKCLDYLRKKKRRDRWSALTGQENGEPADTTEGAHPGVALENREQSVYLFRAIDRLPENQRAVIVLRHFEGLSYNEIATVMDTTHATVQSLLFRARQNLKKQLGKWYKEINNQ